MVRTAQEAGSALVCSEEIPFSQSPLSPQGDGVGQCFGAAPGLAPDHPAAVGPTRLDLAREDDLANEGPGGAPAPWVAGDVSTAAPGECWAGSRQMGTYWVLLFHQAKEVWHGGVFLHGAHPKSVGDHGPSWLSRSQGHTRLVAKGQCQWSLPSTRVWAMILW